MTEIEPMSVDIASLDAQYVPFPDFSEWMGAKVDSRRWDETMRELNNARNQVEEQVLESGIDFALRTAAIDTGAIEGLYEVDRGFTISVAMDAAGWQARAKELGEGIERFFESQRAAYNLVLDAVTQETPLSEAWLRAVHEQLCEPQDTYKVLTPQGWQEHELPKGVYKDLPNHVVTGDGNTFAYSPVAMTAPEMHRLLEQLQSESFQNAHPALQATYAHYSLVRIHPFADGNGRVARALASLYSLRAVSIPLIIFADQRIEYFDALESADVGDRNVFIDFILNRIIDGMLIQIDRLKAIHSPDLEQSAQALDQLHKAYRGLRHFELDDAAYQFAEAILGEVRTQLSELRLPGEVKHLADLASVTLGGSDQRPGYRSPLKNQGRRVHIRFTSEAPAAAQVDIGFYVYVSVQESEDAELLVAGPNEYASLGARVDAVYPERSQAFEIRLNFWVKGILRTLVNTLQEDAAESLNRSGYS